MAKDTPTFEEVDQHIQKADLSAFEPGGEHYVSREAKLTAAAIPGQICPIYQIIRPILAMILGLPFVPKKWKDALKIFMTAMDMICAGA
jgi:hypothetical protein